MNDAPAAAVQRHYRAPCPSCGAPVVFQSAQSTHAVCGYCRSTVAREGDVLRRIGQMAEQFVDFSLLQLGATGRIEGQGFTLVGRLQYAYPEGVWTEWHALMADGSSAWLAEDNGGYVFSRALALPPGAALPAAGDLALGQRLALNARHWHVSSQVSARLINAEGELPRLPARGKAHPVVELRADAASADALPRVLSIDYASDPPAVFEGRPVQLDALELKGLRAESAQTVDSVYTFDCPRCGAPVSLHMMRSETVVCTHCSAVIDLAQGLDGQLKFSSQAAPSPHMRIALGATGRLDGAHWQVLGFQRRAGTSVEDEEVFEWSEYLLYNATQGFAFLMHADDGWSLVRPVTDWPELTEQGQAARYKGERYPLQWTYAARTNEVRGEFYWQVHVGQTTHNHDYANGASVLSLESSGHELVWSAGRKISVRQVAEAFGLPEAELETAPGPLSGGAGGIFGFWFAAALVFLLIFLMFQCANEVDEGYSRSGGGAYGGYRSGGGHK